MKKLLRKLFGYFNDGKWKESLRINDIKFVVYFLESLLSDREKGPTNLGNKIRSGRKLPLQINTSVILSIGPCRREGEIMRFPRQRRNSCIFFVSLQGEKVKNTRDHP